ncbi:maltose alpha-D-glucosyltransferase/alpha-amylase [Rhizomicrobium palustre]|uniref:maltose alpha-D-glucosyltransferase n=1 Tax=Rhizomicrobium palustre TaxID=189966 RepID=A0A846N1W9_9PROT|nr:maltose alpha-D-glucosyltransferase [Rhizomicrobium palustre]NIK89212.1 maltose alpha-D-glucosyltransferase/alpha-amylase [Rhizomicrobium palustre]
MNIRLDPNILRATSPTPLTGDPLWYKDAVIYQLHVKSFYDSNNDGVGDFQGLIDKLDYIAELGVNVLWLLPFYPSPRRDDGYDISDYTGVHPEYGTLDDVQRFIAEAHMRGIRVITELVVNHTSDQHAWFQRARKAPPGSPERDFYVWSDSDKKYGGTRIIFLDTEKSNWTWDEEAKAYYWHRFYFHQPDLNFDNPLVMEECLKVLRFWLDMGVDGLRLDAVPYLVEREGTINENLPETHEILKRFRAEVDANYPGRVLLAEANQWPEDVQQYFGNDDECHMLFHFPLMPRMYMALAQEDRFPITDILRQTPDAPPNSQWTTFLRNHDELTLEMVTDNERDYLWNTYASDRRARLNLGIRRRLAPLMERDFRRIELMNALLLTIMGTPVLYYGDEIGMGDNIHLGDRDGVRTAMQWSPDRNGGFSRADAEALIVSVISNPLYGYQSVNVETQWRDPHSLLNRLRRGLVIRGQHKAFGRGSLRFLRPANRKVFAYLREYESETILCVANVSRSAQAVELDLSEFTGRTPVELGGNVPFPKIGQLTYLLTLPPFGFYWFALSSEAAQPGWSTSPGDSASEHYTFVLRDGIHNVLEGRSRDVLERDVLPGYLSQSRWFQQKSQEAPAVRLETVFQIAPERSDVVLAEVATWLPDQGENRYSLPLALAWEDEPSAPQDARLALARVRHRARVGLLTDASASPKFLRAVLAALAQRGEIASGNERLLFTPQPDFTLPDETAEIRWLGGDSSNSAAVIGQEMMVKIFRRLVDGIHPEVEMVKELTQRGFTGIAALLGDVALMRSSGGGATIMVVQRFIRNQGDGFQWSVEQAKRLLEDPATIEEGHDGFETVSHFVSVSGERLGQMHRELAQPTENQDFAPVAAERQTIETWAAKTKSQVDGALEALAQRDVGVFKDEFTEILENHDVLMAGIDSRLESGIGSNLTRIHGDLHLGQVLVAAGDAIIVDFEGEPLKPISERRAKNSAMRDVAGMLRSFSYVVWTAAKASPLTVQRDVKTLLGNFEDRCAAAFMEGYIRGREQPLSETEEKLLRVFMLERAAYEICYEIANRPDQLAVPLSGFIGMAREICGLSGKPVEP